MLAKDLESDLQPTVRKCMSVPSSTIPQRLYSSPCSEVRNWRKWHIPSYIAFQVTPPYLTSNVSLRVSRRKYMHWSTLTEPMVLGSALTFSDSKKLSSQLTSVLPVTCSVAVLWPELWLQWQSDRCLWGCSGIREHTCCYNSLPPEEPTICFK